MIACPHCSHLNRDTATFCQNCGLSLDPAHMTLIRSGVVLQSRYAIKRVLDTTGGMSVIYEAADQNLGGTRCALKAMSMAKLPPADLRDAVENFKREATLLAQLAHPHLPRVTDNFEDSGQRFLVMDFIEGESLAKKLDNRNREPFPERDVLEWIGALCDVLDYLHSQTPPIIFRDLKPGNVMITSAGQLKLIDFGIARFFKPGKAKDTQAFGTPGYAAPEQFGPGQTDARSDVYSLGVTMHELLTGHDPGATPFILPPARRLNPKISPEVESVIVKATQADPEMRYQSASEMKQALPVRQTPKPAPPVTPPPRPAVAPVYIAPLPKPQARPAPPVTPPPRPKIMGLGRRWEAAGCGCLTLLCCVLTVVGAFLWNAPESFWRSLGLG